MAEYVEREALLDEINSAPVSMSICMNVDECKGRIYERERLVRVINGIPAADVAPVVHGRWEWYDSFSYRCSACKKYWIVPGDQYDYHYDYNYCHNCGAKMDKDGDRE